MSFCFVQLPMVNTTPVIVARLDKMGVEGNDGFDKNDLAIAIEMIVFNIFGRFSGVFDGLRLRILEWRR